MLLDVFLVAMQRLYSHIVHEVIFVDLFVWDADLNVDLVVLETKT